MDAGPHYARRHNARRSLDPNSGIRRRPRYERPHLRIGAARESDQEEKDGKSAREPVYVG